MPAANAAVIYGTVSGLVRWYVHADTDAEIALVTPGAGESLLLVPLATQNVEVTYQAAVNLHTGLTPPDPHCAVMDVTGNVVMIVKADANIDSPGRIHPQGATISNCAGNPLGVGDRWNASLLRWERFYSVVSRSTNIVQSQGWFALINPVPPTALTEYVAPSSYAIGATVPVRIASATAL